MAARDFLVRAEPGFSLPLLERLAPPPPPELIASRIESRSAPGDVVIDLHGRGGWVARAAIDHQRRAVTLESSPLSRLLAEIVLRPPDIRHLDAAFQALGASPRGDTSLRLAIAERFATRCATCDRSLVADEISWEVDDDGAATPIRKHYRCTVCRDQQGGGEQRAAPLDQFDRVRATSDSGLAGVRASLAGRFPLPPGADDLADQLLDLHTPRQLLGLAAILERIEGDLRAAPVEAALRLAFIHAILPSSRLNTQTGRATTLRISGGRVRRPGAGTWRERNPWLAFEDGFRLVRGFVQRLEGSALGPIQARFGEDLRALGEGAATVVVRSASPSALATLERDAREATRVAARVRVRLVIGQPPVRPSQERLALAYVLTAWGLGRDAALTVPVEPLLASSWRTPWAWQAAALRRSLEAVAPLLGRDGRVVLFLEASGPEALVTAAFGGAGAGYRLLDARLAEHGDEVGGVVELLPPGAPLPPGARTRANVTLEPVHGGAGDADLVPGPGLFAAPERFDARPFSPQEAARVVTDTVVEVLRARGEPARTDHLLGQVLIGLDRSGQLRRMTLADRQATSSPDDAATADDAAGDGATAAGDGPTAAGDDRAPAPRPDAGGERDASSPPRDLVSTARRRAAAPTDAVERLVALIRDELARPGQRRLVEIEPDRWWLSDAEDRAAAAVPLADRVEWAVYSLLSTAGPLSEAAFFERIAALFSGHDLPDETLVRACLDSYRSLASTTDRLVTNEDLLRRSSEHSALLALLADGGHRLGLHVWLARREQARRVEGALLGDRLDPAERSVNLGVITRAPIEDLETVDAIWYVRGRATFLFEVEWTAMLGEPLLRRHARIPQDERMVRFLVVAPERTELVRYKLERSPLLRAAIEAGNWHVLKTNHLRTFLGREEPSLADLEPFLGLDPVVERGGEQLPLFRG